MPLIPASRDAVIVMGASGHAKVIIEILRERDVEIACCVARVDAPPRCLGIPVLCGDEALQQLHDVGHRRAVVAVGDNRVRARLADHLRQLGFTLVSAVSQHATLSPSATVGEGVAIMAGVVVNADTQIADLAIINTGATVDHDCHIGRSVHVAPQCALAGNVAVGEHTLVGIGARIIPGITIGRDVTIGAGAVVTADVPDGLTVVGVPAREVGLRSTV
jgi:UDP-perosamine 4-acetyltransferase